MTKAHRYIENQIVKISRGTLNRQPLLMAGEDSVLPREIFSIFVRDALRFNISILALNVDPFGYEAVIFDPKMQRSAFLKSVHQCISMAVKRKIEHEESVWANRKPGNAAILDLDTLAALIIGICKSPIEKGYVSDLENWPLPRIGPSDWSEGIEEFQEGIVGDLEGWRLDGGKKLKVSSTQKSDSDWRSQFIRAAGTNIGPARMLEGPGKGEGGPGRGEDGWKKTTKQDREHKNVNALLGAVFTKITKLKATIIEEIAAFQSKATASKGVSQKTGSLKISFFSKIPRDKRPRFEMREKLLCSNESRRFEALAMLEEFYEAYKIALEDFAEREESSFPHGTLKMRIQFNVAVKSAPTSDVFNFE